MSISGLVVHVNPKTLDAVSQRVAALEGVEIHAATAEGRLVVTVDQPDRKAADTFSELQAMDGVLNTSLIYNYFEQDDAEKESAQ